MAGSLNSISVTLSPSASVVQRIARWDAGRWATSRRGCPRATGRGRNMARCRAEADRIGIAVGRWCVRARERTAIVPLVAASRRLPPRDRLPYSAGIMTGKIHVGIGGWTFEPWRGVVLSRRPHPEARAGVCQPQAHLDRDQRHLLFELQAGELGQVARRDAGRLRLRGEGLALLHQPPRAGRGRRIGAALRRRRGWSSWRTGWGRSTGSSWAPRSSIPRTSRPS